MKSFSESWIHFKVARLDVRVSKRGKVEKKEKKSKMAAKLQKLREYEAATKGVKMEDD